MRLGRCFAVATGFMAMTMVPAHADPGGSEADIRRDRAHSNSVSAQTCNKNGYKRLQRGDGGGFASTGACASYAARGGVLFAPTVGVTRGTSGPCLPGNRYTCFSYIVNGSGFHPNSFLSFAFLYTTPQTQSSYFPNLITSAPSGEFTKRFGENCWLAGDRSYNGPVVVAITVTDAEGVHASGQLTTTCP